MINWIIISVQPENVLFPYYRQTGTKGTYEDERFYVKVPSSLIDDPNDLYVNWLLTHLARDLELVKWN